MFNILCKMKLIKNDRSRKLKHQYSRKEAALTIRASFYNFS